MKASKQAAGSACPSVEEYAEQMRRCDACIVVTLSGKLSGSYNSARVARDMVLEESPGKQIHILDSESASAGELRLALYLKELIDAGEDFDTVVEKSTRFMESMRTLFVLEDLGNLVKNGRLNKVSGIVASVLSLCPIMSDDGHGEIRMAAKARGMKQALMKLTSLIAQGDRRRGAPFPDPDYGLLQLPGTGGTAPRRDSGKLPGGRPGHHRPHRRRLHRLCQRRRDHRGLRRCLTGMPGTAGIQKQAGKSRLTFSPLVFCWGTNGGGPGTGYRIWIE